MQLEQIEALYAEETELKCRMFEHEGPVSQKVRDRLKEIVKQREELIAVLVKASLKD